MLHFKQIAFKKINIRLFLFFFLSPFLHVNIYSQCWKDISSNGVSSFLFGSDGSLWAVGDNSNGSFGNGNLVSTINPIQINQSNVWKKIELGYGWVIAIKNDGTLWAWGNNNSQTMGFYGSGIFSQPIQIGANNKWIDIKLGDSHSLGLQNDGTLWAWGSNQSGQCGIDIFGSIISSPTQIGSENDWESISTSQKTSFAIKKNGSLWAWGNNEYGLVTSPTYFKQKTPLRIGTDDDWKSVSGGGNRVFAIKGNGTLWGWGNNSDSLLGIEIFGPHVPMTQIGNGNDWYKILSVGRQATFALKENNEIWGWGDNSKKLIDSLAGNFIPTPTKLSYSNNLMKIENKIEDTFYLNEKGEVQLWGRSKFKNISTGKTKHRFNQIGNQDNWINVSTGSSHSLALNSNNQLFVWGKSNIYHSLKGDGSDIIYIKYPIITTATEVAKFNANYSSTLIIKDDGSLWGWGNNQSLVLGPNSLGFSTITRSGILYEWKEISSNYFHTLALDNFGNLYSWGLNDFGECGQGNINPASYSSIIGNNYKIAKTGLRFSGAIKNDGSLWMWGLNADGQLGDGTFSNKNLPTRIGSENNWKDIVLGLHFTIALKEDGSLWAWGNNVGGSLGIGNIPGNILNTPQRIGNENNWKNISGGKSSSLAIKTDGSLWGWGPNLDGVLGNGTINNYVYVPTRIGIENDWNKISVSDNVSLAIKNDGTLWSSGHDDYVGYDYFESLPQSFSCLSPSYPLCAQYKYFDSTNKFFNLNSHTEVSSTSGLIISREKITVDIDKSYKSPVTILKPGFEAEKGSLFKIEVGGCNN